MWTDRPPEGPSRAVRARPERARVAVPLHSHPETEPRPSRTDLENIGLWQGKPYVIYGLALDDLRAYTIEDGRAHQLELE